MAPHYKVTLTKEERKELEAMQILKIITRTTDGDCKMTKLHPAHPGLTLKEDCLDYLGLSITDAADALGVTRLTLSKIINGHSGVSADMALRFEKMGWSNADMWLRMQQQYDLAEARRNSSKIKVSKAKAKKELTKRAAVAIPVIQKIGNT